MALQELFTPCQLDGHIWGQAEAPKLQFQHIRQAHVLWSCHQAHQLDLSNLKLSLAGKANKSPLIYIYIIHLYVYICTYNASSFTDWLLCGSVIHRTVSSIGAWATAQANLSLTVYVNCFSYLISLVYGGHSYACWRFDGHFEASHSSYARSPAPPLSFLLPICLPKLTIIVGRKLPQLYSSIFLCLPNSSKIPGTTLLLSPFLVQPVQMLLLPHCQIQLCVQFTHCRVVNFKLLSSDTTLLPSFTAMCVQFTD